jgi:hypothetical protein
VVWGGNATFSVMVTDVGPLTYQWRLNGTNLPNNIITTVAGNGIATYAGDGGLATKASLNQPQGVAFNAAGNLFIADNNNDRVRMVDMNGIITTVAGNGVGAGSGGGSLSGDGGAATKAGLYRPNNLAFDMSGNMYIADIFNQRIRKVHTNGNISTVAGSFGPGFLGDGGPAIVAAFYNPACVALDSTGNLFIADLFNSRIRKVDTNGIITTVAGGGGMNPGEGGAATNAALSTPQGVALDAGGNYYIADTLNNRIRKVDTNGIITTVAGKGSGTYGGDGGSATNAYLSQPWGMTVDAAGNMFIADLANNMIRKVATNGIITTVAGNRVPNFSGDGGAATNASLDNPACVALDAAGNLFIADWKNNRIRKVLYTTHPTLALYNVSTTNAGNYSVIITSASGSVTSSVASLTLQLPPLAPLFTASNGLCTFTWSAVSNQTYQLQSATNLAAPVWLDLGSPVTDTSNAVSASDTVGADSQRFYRVRLWP